jgi:hypothetical protein
LEKDSSRQNGPKRESTGKGKKLTGIKTNKSLEKGKYHFLSGKRGKYPVRTKIQY